MFSCILYFNETKHSPETGVFLRFLTTLFFGFVILEQNFSYNSFYKFSHFQMLTKWGKYTYGLYLLHPITITFTLFALSIYGYNSTKFITCLIQAVISLISALIISYLSYNYFENYFLKLKGKFTPTSIK
jgi:peptidoglycan/LPS O-acetylase OafA/YrhL